MYVTSAYVHRRSHYYATILRNSITQYYYVSGSSGFLLDLPDDAEHHGSQSVDLERPHLAVHATHRLYLHR